MIAQHLYKQSGDNHFLQSLEGNPHVLKVTSQTLLSLSALLSSCTCEDSYRLSASYYGLTGRRGLWVYVFNQSFLVFCIHPNVREQVLVFPPFGKDSIGLIKKFLSEVKEPKNGFLFGRLSEEDTSKFSNYSFFQGQHSEDVLDWHFPSYNLSTEQVIAHKGKSFKDFRKNISRSSRLSIKIDEISLNSHQNILNKIVDRWAREHESESFSYEDLVGPHKAIMNILNTKDMRIKGKVFYLTDSPAGYIIWEETNSDTANSLANFAFPKTKGISERMYLEMCKSLKGSGYKYVCIGGSESSGLDDFKKKMCPSKSLKLSSAYLSLSEEEQRIAA